MLIECSRCQTRYRMNESMMRGFKWAEVRCRKCAETIVVLPPVMRLETPESADPADRASVHRNPPSPREKPGPADKREDPPPGRARHGSIRAEAKAQPSPALEEEASEPVPDNVYSLALFREIRPKRLPTGGFDISGSIRPEPLLLTTERKPAAPPQTPATTPEQPGPVQSRLFNKPIEWRSEGIAPSADVPPFPSAMETGDPSKTSSRKARFRTGLSYTTQTRLSHIAIVYLIILILSGCGYLLVLFLSRLMSGAGG